jgi:murein DD-endopeptidase MepM/ murein hydrolase activator NlpD
LIVRQVWAAVGVTVAVSVLAACGQLQGVHQGSSSAPPPTLVSFRDGAAPGPRTTFTVTGSRSDPDPMVAGGTTTPQPSPRAGNAHDVSAEPLHACPVRGRGYFVSNFGAYRPGPPVHAHQGNDIFVPHGTPVVAPFAGVAVATPNVLGGKAVKVFGADGYVYNAHLMRYGDLGHVSVGDVIGLVGSTGNAPASAPHDHFEWHPGDGNAIDPFPYLMQACPPS